MTTSPQLIAIFVVRTYPVQESEVSKFLLQNNLFWNTHDTNKMNYEYWQVWTEDKLLNGTQVRWSLDHHCDLIYPIRFVRLGNTSCTYLNSLHFKNLEEAISWLFSCSRSGLAFTCEKSTVHPYHWSFTCLVNLLNIMYSPHMNALCKCVSD